MPRLFVGTFLPEDGQASIQTLARDNGNLNESWNTKLRWVGSSKLHMTWIFLGDINDSLIPDVSAKLGKAVDKCRSENRLALSYDSFELWPNERRARLGVVTPSLVPPHVHSIDKALKEELLEFLPEDLRQHEKPVFQPHITVVRFPHQKRKEKASGPTARISEVVIAPSVFPITHSIDQIALIESDLGKSQGYEAISVFNL
ncbi:MAG: hypothetical protein K2X93_03020 [Candidatus Obscuribacterales bacterium]|nr:hypothetical protein [Candidatus Obscuribacterales bacterium]